MTVLVLAALVPAACARKAAAVAVIPETPPVVRLEAADRQLRAGCRDCLIEALRDFEALRSVPAARDRATAAAARAAALIALRDRELGTPEYGHMERARELAAELAAASPELVELLDIADALPSPGRVATSDAQLTAARRYTQNRDAWTAWVRARAAGDELSAYLWVRMGCEAAQPVSGDVALQATGAAAETTLLAYKEAISCSRGNTGRLQAVLDREPRFLEVHYFLGFAALSGQTSPGAIGRPDLDGADRHFSAAYAWLEEWPALTTAIAGVAMTAEDFVKALQFYRRTLDMVPDQPDALLGTVRALTYLGEYVEALAATDRLLAIQRLPGDARYWRAFNELNLGRIDEAWADVELASKMLATPDVPKLAGVVAFRRRELALARGRFEQAYTARPTDCETGYYFQATLAELREWQAAVDIAAATAVCFDHDEAQLLREIADMRGSNAAPERRQRVILKREQQLAANARMRSTALFNAAAASFNLGRRDDARLYAEKIADDNQFGERARAIIERAR